jgi:hypothetical protein
MSEFKATNPRKEAQELLPAGFEARVLEPSPPAVNDGEYRADDPAAVNGRSRFLQVVTPTTAGDVTWDDLAPQFPHLSEFASSHWVGAWSRLRALPDGYTSTVIGLGQVAFFVIAPARYREQEKIGLRYTFGGFGTPFYGRDRQVRVEGQSLVVQDGDTTDGGEITTIRQAARLVGIDYSETWGPHWQDPPAPGDPDAALVIDPGAARACSDIIGFGFSVLEQIRVEARDEEKPSRVQLWPEHFDAAVDIGVEDIERRAGFGVSPGYPAHPEPFVYVSPWAKDWLNDPYWNADFFGGSILTYSELLKADDQRGTALAFLRRGLELVRDR